MIVQKNQSQHWYRAVDGRIERCYELPKKDGKGMKSVTLREARELGLLYSVTKVCDVLRKPALEAWKQEQAILAALTLPRLDGEGVDAFCKRVVEDMNAQSEKAKEFGSSIHAAIENYLTGVFSPTELEPWIKSVMQWADAEIDFAAVPMPITERVVGSAALGIAGRLDLVCMLQGKPAVVDFKTQRVKVNGKGIKQPVFYDEWPMQLAAYGYCIMCEFNLKKWPELVSVIIDSSEPGPVFVKQWENPAQSWELFKMCYDLTCYLNDYDPRTPRGLQ